MTNDVNATLAEAISDQTSEIEASTAQTRATNVLLLASAMGEDPLEPLARAKVLRHLEVLERAVKAHD